MMERTIAITGAASGMGLATAGLLRSRGHRVIGIDLHDADVTADLGSPAGRAAMIAAVSDLAPHGLDGVVACAGVAIRPDRDIFAINYFGAIATLTGLRPLLLQSRSPRAVLIASTAVILPHDDAMVNGCLHGDEAALLAAADGAHDIAYASSKYAAARWLRRAAVTPEWGGSGILLNAVGPGRIRTPMIEPILASAEGRAALAAATPMVDDRPYALPEDIAETIAFLLEMERSFLMGQLIYVDGGTDAILRPEFV